MTEPADVQHHLTVSATTKVIGRVRSGATVQAGAALTVQGVLEGPVTVESDGILVVQGTFSGDIVRNDGSVMLHGVVVMNDSPPVGTFIIGIGSVITSDGNAYILEADGRLTEAQGTIPALTINTDDVCFFDEAERRFRPLRKK